MEENHWHLKPSSGHIVNKQNCKAPMKFDYNLTNTLHLVRKIHESENRYVQCYYMFMTCIKIHYDCCFP